MDLTISIVNWNVREYLEQCLESIFKYSDGIDLEVIVVDNASQDGSVEMVKNKFPGVAIIENRENIGYGCGHNQAIKIANGKYILFLNPDTEMLPDTLPKMLEFMDSHSEVGVSECIEIRDREDTKEVITLTKAGRLKFLFYKNINRIFPRFFSSYYGNFIARQMYCSRRSLKLYDQKEGLEGGFLFVRKQALDQTDGFDPMFFYGEEGTRLTRRIRKLGWKLYRVTGVKVIHYGSKSADRINDYGYTGERDKRWRESLGP